MALWLLLGRHGDLLIGLPMMHAEFLATGQKQKLVVSAEYADTVSGCSYLEPIIWDGAWNDLGRAYKYAQTLSKNVRVCQVAGPKHVLDKIVYGGKFDRQTDSFECEMYRVAGAMQLWPKNLPLMFDKRDKTREGILLQQLFMDMHWKKREQPLILVSTSGFSSPFQYTELLWDLLETRLKGYNVVDISNLKAERIYDLLGLYEKARCLIATDSAPLHLAQAVNLPVCALIADTPTLWHGSAWRPNHISYVRYSNFPRDYRKMFEAVENIGKPGSRFVK